MKSVLLTGSPEREKDLMRRNTKIALVLCLAVLGTTIEARAEDCQHVRGGITDTTIPSPNDPFGRGLGNVTGALSGAFTGIITSLNPPNATSLDVFVTKRGDMLTAIGAGTITPVPGEPGEFIGHVDLTITGGSGKYDGATGWIKFEGQGHLGGPGVGTFDVIYRGSVCGPNLKADEALGRKNHSGNVSH
jgi:hypothetical protein